MFANIAALPESGHVFLATVLGLLVGSFLNVVIYRYPRLLKFQWTSQSHEWLNKEPYPETPPPGIVKPRSYCGHCKTPIKAWQNIPIISYLLLRGKCANCDASISLRYPFVELLTGVLSGVVVYQFGFTYQALFGLILTWVLISLSFIDFDHKLLPDDIVLPTLWLGLGLSTLPLFVTSSEAIIGAVFGYLSFWCVFHLFKLATGKEGMGYGDFKLLSLLGAWFGWQVLPQIILISTVLGALIGLALIVLKKTGEDNTIPFGPYIAMAGWIAMIWGEKINRIYLSSMGLG